MIGIVAVTRMLQLPGEGELGIKNQGRFTVSPSFSQETGESDQQKPRNGDVRPNQRALSAGCTVGSNSTPLFFLPKGERTIALPKGEKILSLPLGESMTTLSPRETFSAQRAVTEECASEDRERQRRLVSIAETVRTAAPLLPPLQPQASDTGRSYCSRLSTLCTLPSGLLSKDSQWQ